MPGELRTQKQAATEYRARQLARVRSSLPRQTISFLELPGEVRNLIYDYALVSKNDVNITDIYEGLGPGHVMPWIEFKLEDALGEPSLTQVSKTVREETLPVFYGAQTFSFHFNEGWEGDCAMRWLEALGVEKRKLLRRVKIVVDKVYLSSFDGRRERSTCADTIKRIHELGTLTMEGERGDWVPTAFHLTFE